MTDFQQVPPKGRSSKFFQPLNIVLILGLVVLYVLHFSDGRVALKTDSGDIARLERSLDQAGNRIAYVNNTRLMEEFVLAIEMREEFEVEQERLESDLTRRQRTFQSDVERFQRRIEAGSIPMEEAQIREQELLQQQQDLIQMNDTYRDRLARMEFEKNEELYEIISDFLERFNQEKGYDFILGFVRGGGILYADPIHDVTPEVIRLLNEEFSTSN